MVRIQKMRLHLARLAKARLPTSDGVATRTGGIVTSMRPPNKLQESLLCQAICSGLLDNVAMLAPPGSLSGDHPYGFRSAYISCSLKEPLFMDQRSAVYTRDFRRLPQWICFDTLVRKTAKDGTPVVTIKNVTPIDPRWLGALSKGSRLLSLGEPLATPPATYDSAKDAIMCSVKTQYGPRGWEIPPVQATLFDSLQKFSSNKTYLVDDSFRFFARFLLEGKVLPELKEIADCWNDDPAIITRKTPIRKVALLVAALSSEGVDSAGALRQHWCETDRKFLFQLLIKSWTKPEHVEKVKKVWMETVKLNAQLWKKQTQ
jgi:ATP-dependent RNA helicase DHX37/DHR1